MKEIYFEIVCAHADYGRCIDDDRLEDWPDFFADDCLYRVVAARDHRDGLEGSIVFANSKGMLRDRVSALRQANVYERQAYRHLIGAPIIFPGDGGRIRSEASFMVARIMRDGATSLFATGRYLDQWRRGDDGVSLVERVVVCDSQIVDTLLAIPL